MVMIRFHILGAGGAVPTASHTPAAYWVTVDGNHILMDPGPGALVRLVKSGAAPLGVDDIDRVILTHLHPDHTGDLVALLFAMHSPLLDSEAPLTIWGPKGFQQLLDQLKGIYGRWLDPKKRELRIHEIDPGARIELSGNARIESFEVNHPQDRLSGKPLGYRFIDKEGRIAVFSGDTGPCSGLEEAAKGVDLLVVECSATDQWTVDGHMSPRDVGPLCQKAQPSRVVLTHQYPEAAQTDLVSAVGKFFEGPVFQARDGDVFFVPEDSSC